MKATPNQMKTQRTPKPAEQGMTLVELLVVISIIAVLAGLVVPALARAKVKAKITQARKDMSDFKGAIEVYISEYTRRPVSTQAQTAANAQTANPSAQDFIYGSYGVAGYKGANTLLNNYPAPNTYEANNSETVLILTATESFPSSTNTVNIGHVMNQRKTVFLNAKQVTGTKAGIGSDGVFRDPFLNPYFVTVDLNFDDFVAPGAYRLASMSQTSGSEGLNGLLHRNPATIGTNPNEFGLREKVAIWTPGPDGQFSPAVKANQSTTSGGVKIDNNDNILTWQ